MRRGIAVAVAASVLATGCSTTVVGQASPAEPAATDQSPAASAQDEAGRRAEAYRLAGATALVEDTFPDRTRSCFPEGEFTDPIALEERYFLPGTAAPILDARGFVTAWGECGQDADGQGTLTLSVELADPAAASAAATELAAASQDASHQAGTVLDGAPLLLATDGTQDTAQIWAPAGRVLAYVFHRTAAGAGRDEAVELVTHHLELLAGFTPTPADAVADLPEDPLGLAGLVAEPSTPVFGAGSFGPESYLRISPDPRRERVLFSQHGFVGMYRMFAGDEPLYQIGVFRFRTPAGAQAVHAAYAAGEIGPPEAEPLELASQPDAACRVGDFQRCYLVGGRHLAVVEVSTVDLDDTTTLEQLLPGQQQLLAG